MKRVMGVVFVVLVCASPASVFAQEPDAEGCTDAKALTRMRGCTISECSKKDYDAAELIVGENQQSQSVEGEVEIVQYACPSSMSLLMIARNAENAVKAQGFATVFKGEGMNNWPMYTGRKGDNWIAIETNETPGYKQTIVLNKAMEQQMTASAADMEAEISRTGECSIYGILFDTGKATIQADSEKCLTEVASLLKKNAAWKMRIEGHTDNVGATAGNLKLSQQRAEAVRSWLVSHGIDATRLTAKGLGDTKPVTDNAAENGRAKNRRVALVKMN